MLKSFRIRRHKLTECVYNTTITVGHFLTLWKKAEGGDATEARKSFRGTPELQTHTHPTTLSFIHGHKS